MYMDKSDLSNDLYKKVDDDDDVAYEGGEDLCWDKKVRFVDEDDIILPCAFAFVVKRLSDYQPDACRCKIILTQIVRIKFTGLPNMEEVMDRVKEDLKFRINESETSI